MKATFFDCIISRRKQAKNKANNQPIVVTWYSYHIQPKDRELAFKLRYYTFLDTNGNIVMGTVDTPAFIAKSGFTNAILNNSYPLRTGKVTYYNK